MTFSFMNPFIFIDQTEQKGRGVFCNQNLEANTLIEIAPVIPLSEKDTKIIHKTALHDYYFSWGDDQKLSAVALGYISIYNHAHVPNCTYEADFENNTIKIISLKEIQKGEELTINYNLDNSTNNTLWFDIK